MSKTKTKTKTKTKAITSASIGKKQSAKPSQNDAGGGGGGETGGNNAGGNSASDQPNPHQLIEQARASHALAWIQEAMAAKGVKQSDLKRYKSDLKSFTRGLPAMIQMNGFGQAMAFYYAKRGKSAAYQAVYDLVETWLCGPHARQQTTGAPIYAADIQGQTQNQAQPPLLLTAITQHNQQRYRHAQAETQALLRWARKFAEALIKKDASTDTPANQGEVEK